MGDLQSALAGLGTGKKGKRRRGSLLKRRGSAAGKREGPSSPKDRVSLVRRRGSGATKGRGLPNGRRSSDSSSPGGKRSFQKLLSSHRAAVAGSYHSSGDESPEWSPGRDSDSS